MTDVSFREIFLSFWVLNLVKAPIIALDGTLPPQTLATFLKLTNTSWRILRMPSNRPELCYKVERVPKNPKYPENTILHHIAGVIPALTADYRAQDRMLVYCRSHAQVETLAKLLGIAPFTSSSIDTNGDSMAAWLRGKQKVIVATSILGCGLDYPSVRHVLHCGIAYTMIDQHQQESRAGRDGAPAMAITYVPAIQYSAINPPSDNDHGLHDLQRWARTEDQCLRVAPSLYLDGVAVTCMLLPGCVLCFYCASQLNASAPARLQLLPLKTTPLQPGHGPYYKSIPIPKRPSLQHVMDSPPQCVLSMFVTDNSDGLYRSPPVASSHPGCV